MTVLLFDIDGTLVSTGGAGRLAYERAFAAEFGPDHGLLDFSFSGMTDPLLIRRGLEAAEREVTPEAVEEMIERYLEHLPSTIEEASEYVVHPGASSLVAEMAGESGYAVGLGTGNVESGARLKLEPAGLNDHFGFGGFGSDAEDRAELLHVGACRGAHRLGRSVEVCRVVVIGDTERDIDAAREIGAETVAVDTGTTDSNTIRRAGPDLFVDDLRSRQLHRFLLGD